jgi:hypothetical protein
LDKYQCTKRQGEGSQSELDISKVGRSERPFDLVQVGTPFTELHKRKLLQDSAPKNILHNLLSNSVNFVLNLAWRLNTEPLAQS